MTNTPSPTDEDRELIGKLRKPDAWSAHIHGNGSLSTVEEAAPFKAADRLESLLSDRVKLARRVRMLANHGTCSCAECKELDALNRSTDRAT